MEYICLQSGCPKDLAEQIELHLNDRWSLSGGWIVWPTENGNLLCQMMVRAK